MCEKVKADLVLLIDQSGSISPTDYSTMKNFTNDLVRSFPLIQDLVRVGVAQFSSTVRKEFYLNRYPTAPEVSGHILKMAQQRGGTQIGRALTFITQFFQKSTGSRAGEGVSQNLVLMTDGASEDAVEQAAEVLRRMGVEMFVLGVGDVQKLELMKITADTDRIFMVKDFGSLAKIKEKVVATICTSKPPNAPPGESAFISTLMCTYHFLPLKTPLI